MTTTLRLDVGLLILRAMTGVIFLFHGSQKLFGLFGGGGIHGTAQFMDQLGLPLPTLSALAAGGVEWLGGLALLLGIGVRVASVPLTVTMLVAAFSAHSGFAAQTGGMEYPLLLAVASAALGLTGPGSLGVGSSLGVRSPAATTTPSHSA